MGQGTRINVAALKRAIIESTGPGKRFSRRKLSLLASGGKNPDLVRDLLSRGQDKNVSFDTAVGIAMALGRDVAEFVVGRTGSIAATDRIKVIGAVEAGVWREQAEWEPDDQFEVDVYPSPLATSRRFGLRVIGHSMDKLFPPGTILDCLGIPGTEGLVPMAGDIVIVQRRTGPLYETTCKCLELTPDGDYQLVAASTRPEFAQPIPIGKPDEGHFGDEDIAIIGIVNTAIQNVFRPR